MDCIHRADERARLCARSLCFANATRGIFLNSVFSLIVRSIGKFKQINKRKMHGKNALDGTTGTANRTKKNECFFFVQRGKNASEREAQTNNNVYMNFMSRTEHKFERQSNGAGGKERER